MEQPCCSLPMIALPGQARQSRSLLGCRPRGLSARGLHWPDTRELPAATNPPTLMLTRLLLLIRRAIGTPSLLRARRRDYNRDAALGHPFRLSRTTSHKSLAGFLVEDNLMTRWSRLPALALSLGCLVIVWSSPALAEVKLPDVIGSNMVLQQGATLPIWGWAESGETVTVSIAGQSVTGKADDDGRWQVKLDKLERHACRQTLGNDHQGQLGRRDHARERARRRRVGLLRPIEYGDGRGGGQRRPGRNRRRQASRHSALLGAERAGPPARFGHIAVRGRCAARRPWAPAGGADFRLLPISSAAICTKN